MAASLLDSPEQLPLLVIDTNFPMTPPSSPHRESASLSPRVIKAFWGPNSEDVKACDAAASTSASEDSEGQFAKFKSATASLRLAQHKAAEAAITAAIRNPCNDKEQMVYTLHSQHPFQIPIPADIPLIKSCQVLREIYKVTCAGMHSYQYADTLWTQFESGGVVVNSNEQLLLCLDGRSSTLVPIEKAFDRFFIYSLGIILCTTFSSPRFPSLTGRNPGSHFSYDFTYLVTPL